MKIEYFKTILESLGKNTITVGIIIAVVPNLIQNNINSKVDRQIRAEAKTIELLTNTYEKESNIGKAINKLDSDFDLSEAYEVLLEGKTKKFEEFAKDFIINDPNRYTDMLVITDYYNAIAFCVESELCDKNIAEGLFKESGHEFFRGYYPFFCYVQDRWGDSLIKKHSVDFYDIKNMNSYLEETCNNLDNI